MILSAYGSAAAFSADRINAPKERPTLRQMFGISAEIEVMLKERHVKRDSSIIRANQHAAGEKGGPDHDRGYDWQALVELINGRGGEAHLGVRGQVGREGEILLRFESRETLGERLVNRRVGIAAERDPLRRGIPVDAVDHYLGHFGRIAERNARPILNETASRAGRAVIIGVHLRAELGAAEPELRACAARLDDGDADIERRDVLHSRLDEAFDSPLARVIQARARKGGLAAIGGDLDYSAAALLAEMRKGRAHHLDRAYQVSVDLVEDLLIR